MNQVSDRNRATISMFPDNRFLKQAGAAHNEYFY